MARADVVVELDVEGAVAEEDGPGFGADEVVCAEEGEGVAVFGEHAGEEADWADAEF